MEVLDPAALAARVGAVPAAPADHAYPGVAARAQIVRTHAFLTRWPSHLAEIDALLLHRGGLSGRLP